MLNLNEVKLIGNLTRDPEIKSTANGKMARVGVAVNRRYRHNGEMKEETTFLNVTCFNEHHVRIFEEYARKGTQVYIQAELRMNKWTDSDGNDRHTLEIVMPPFRSDLQLGGRPQGHSESNASSQQQGENNTENAEPSKVEPEKENSAPVEGNAGSANQQYMDQIPF